MATAKQITFVIGCLLLILVDFLWTFSSVLVQHLIDNHFDKPIIITYFSTSVFALYLPVFYTVNALRRWYYRRKLPVELVATLHAQLEMEMHAQAHTPTQAEKDPQGTWRHTPWSHDVEGEHVMSLACLDASSSAVAAVSTPVTAHSPLLNTTVGSPLSSSSSPASSLGSYEGASHHHHDHHHDHHDMHTNTPLTTPDQYSHHSTDDDNNMSTYLSTYRTLLREASWTTFLHNFKIALVIGPLWYSMNVTYNSALKIVSVTTNTILSTTSAFFVMLLGVCVYCQRMKFLQLVCVLGAIVGAAFVVYMGTTSPSSDGGSDGDDDTSPQVSTITRVIGVGLCIASAFLYGAYSFVIDWYSDRDLPIHERREARGREADDACRDQLQQDAYDADGVRSYQRFCAFREYYFEQQKQQQQEQEAAPCEWSDDAIHRVSQEPTDHHLHHQLPHVMTTRVTPITTTTLTTTTPTAVEQEQEQEHPSSLLVPCALATTTTTMTTTAPLTDTHSDSFTFAARSANAAPTTVGTRTTTHSNPAMTITTTTTSGSYEHHLHPHMHPHAMMLSNDYHQHYQHQHQQLPFPEWHPGYMQSHQVQNGTQGTPFPRPYGGHHHNLHNHTRRSPYVDIPAHPLHPHAGNVMPTGNDDLDHYGDDGSHHLDDAYAPLLVTSTAATPASRLSPMLISTALSVGDIPDAPLDTYDDLESIANNSDGDVPAEDDDVMPLYASEHHLGNYINSPLPMPLPLQAYPSSAALHNNMQRGIVGTTVDPYRMHSYLHHHHHQQQHQQHQQTTTATMQMQDDTHNDVHPPRPYTSDIPMVCQPTTPPPSSSPNSATKPVERLTLTLPPSLTAMLHGECGEDSRDGTSTTTTTTTAMTPIESVEQYESALLRYGPLDEAMAMMTHARKTTTTTILVESGDATTALTEDVHSDAQGVYIPMTVSTLTPPPPPPPASPLTTTPPPFTPQINTGLLFGCIGLVNLFLAWPFFAIFHLSGIERLSFPPREAMGMIMLNAFCGAAGSDFLWANAVLLTNPIIATLAIPGTIPMAMAYDVFKGEQTLNVWVILGSILIVASGSVVTIHTYFTNKRTTAMVEQMHRRQQLHALQQYVDSMWYTHYTSQSGVVLVPSGNGKPYGESTPHGAANEHDHCATYTRKQPHSTSDAVL